MIKTGDIEKDSLLLLLRNAIKCENEKINSNVNLNLLLKLAVGQQVYTTILPQLENMGLLDGDVQQNWKNYRLTEIQKNIIVGQERENLCQGFEQNGVPYMFMKGLIIRNYYPQELMRQMTDNDILYDVSKRDVMFKVLKENGFYMQGTQGASDDFFKAPYCVFEMHKTLFHDNCEVKLDLDLWKRATKAEGYNYRYNMSKEDNYIYSLAHMYKHYTSRGCGVRFLCDTYLLHYSGDDLDFKYINKMLQKFELTDFNDRVLSLVDSIFLDKTPSEADERFLGEIFEGGVFGKNISLDESIKASGGKLKYLWHRAFPSKEFMYRNYEKLNKKPYLLIYYYIVHLTLQLKNKREKANKIIKNVLRSK